MNSFFDRIVSRIIKIPGRGSKSNTATELAKTRPQIFFLSAWIPPAKAKNPTGKERRSITIEKILLPPSTNETKAP